MTQHDRPTLTGAEPQRFVGDIRTSCDFFTMKLGFPIAFLHGAPPFYAQVVRDQARLNLRHVDQPLFDNYRCRCDDDSGAEKDCPGERGLSSTP